MGFELTANKPERIVDYFVVVGLDSEVVPLQNEPFALCDDRYRGDSQCSAAPTEVAGSPSAAETYENAVSRVLNTRYRAAVLDRFPLVDFPDTELPPQVAMFALPEGLTVKVPCSRGRALILEPGNSLALALCPPPPRQITHALRCRDGHVESSPADCQRASDSLLGTPATARCENKQETCPLPTFYLNVFTSNEGKRLYAAVLTFHEEVQPAALHRMLHGTELPHRKDLPASSACVRRPPLWLPKCICSLSHWLFFEMQREFLKQLYRVSLTASRVPIERLISNLIYEVPLPPRGCVRVLYSIADQNCVLARPPPNQLPFSQVPLDALFSLLELSNVVDLFAAVLLERKILFYSAQPAVLALVAEAILSLIFPFKWEHVYIPVLPLQVPKA